MFLSAAARPDPERNFDGEIGIWRVADTYMAQEHERELR
jgi:hypothetical protein